MTKKHVLLVSGMWIALIIMVFLTVLTFMNYAGEIKESSIFRFWNEVNTTMTVEFAFEPVPGHDIEPDAGSDSMNQPSAWNDDYAGPKKGQIVNCEGESMQPTLICGATKVVYLNPDNLAVGDIIKFSLAPYKIDGVQMNYDFVVHRIFDEKTVNGTRYYKTKGDNNRAPDYLWLDERYVIQELKVVRT